MVEVIARAGVWTFDGEVLRIVPSHRRSVHRLRKALGELKVPVAAVGGIAYEPGRRGGRLRLRLRAGSDPFFQITGGQLADEADPYRLIVEPEDTGPAEYLVDEVRHALLLEEVPDGPTDRYLLPGPAVPLTAEADDGQATFDGTLVRLEWSSQAKDAKKAAGPQQFAVDDLDGVEWTPSGSIEHGPPSPIQPIMSGGNASMRPDLASGIRWTSVDLPPAAIVNDKQAARPLLTNGQAGD